MKSHGPERKFASTLLRITITLVFFFFVRKPLRTVVFKSGVFHVFTYFFDGPLNDNQGGKKIVNDRVIVSVVFYCGLKDG